MSSSQPAILAPVPPVGRFLSFGLVPDRDPGPGLARLAARELAPSQAIGLGQSLVLGLGRAVPGLRAFPALSGPGVGFPSTQGALWSFLGGDDPGDLVLAASALADLLGEAFRLEEDVAVFKHRGGRDLSDYEDGTANPTEAAAVAAAVVSGAGAGLDGSSFVAAQRWVHDLRHFHSLAPGERDAIVGRRHDDNAELGDAPPSAHIKRTEQESFDPPAFVVRRSMPYGDASEHGLYFVAYGHSLDAFERQLRRMAGLDDGITDGLLRFSRAVSGGYYWCPPVTGGRLELTALGR